MPENRGAFEISVVLAAPDGGPGLACCLEALDSQIAAVGGEILVVDGSGIGSGVRRPFHSRNTRWISRSAGTEVPDLWRAGIEASRGKTIALLVESCVPDPDWAGRIVQSHESDATAIGGAIDLVPTSGLVDSAVYFCRYSQYMPPFTAQYLDDLPGINCSYKRTALDGLQEEMADGFWETFIHRKMRSRGDRLLCDPSIVVRHVGRSSGFDFFRSRFAHGRRFAARGAADLNPRQRTLRALAFPFVPILMLRRIAARVWARRRYRARFLACLPLLTVFLAAWSAGEYLGYLFGPAARIGSAARQRNRVLGGVS